MPRLDSLALNRIILGDLYPQATAEQLDKGARWRATAPTGPRAADYDRDPELFRHDLEMEMFGRAEPPHQHVVNEHSALKFNGGQPVLLCAATTRASAG